MPIYAYKCSACGHADDVMQKISAAPLTTCPKCGAESFSKQLTAPGFALKGSGWYVTDFRDSKKSGGAATTKTEAPAAGEAASTSGADASPAPASTPAAPAPSAPATKSEAAPHVHTPNCAH